MAPLVVPTKIATYKLGLTDRRARIEAGSRLDTP
jgi:hypothetical protein